ncbi:MAG: FKBP-type peptidyl-prolyl cis-trans isomerase [Xanthomonadales bacterium]|nr:FKBP-type peptidyl-prolyl cis-trans isomerase [Xanthomonadales bacterium]
MNSLIRRGLAVAIATFAVTAMAQDLQTEEQKLGYIIGMDIGNSLRSEGTQVDMDALVDALRTVYAGDTPKLTAEEAQAIRQEFIAKRRAAAEAEANAISSKNKAEGEAFLAENAAKEGVQVTDTGLQYKVVRMGEGPKPTASDVVEVHYRGTLLDGTEFDSSYARDESVTFELDRVIPGWTEGVQLMPVGSKFMFYIKPELAYGEGGGGPIPPNSTLVFEVELLGIETEE